jgi:PAS domain S-box-containing protein
MSKLFKKTLIIMILMFGAVASAVSIYSAWMNYERLIEEYKSKAIAISNNIASSSLEIFLNRDAATIQSIVDEYSEIKGVAYVLVAYEDGEIISHTFAPQIPEKIRGLIKKRPSPKDEVTVTNIDLPDRGAYLDVSSPILSGVAGYVHVGMDLDELRSYIGQAMVRQHAITFVLFLLAVVVAYLFINNISRPLQELARYADRLAERDFDAVVEIKSDDEIGLLARTMNNMARETKNLIAGLENSIQEATRELQDTLVYLSAIIENLAEGLIVVDSQGKITRYNQALLKMFALEGDQTGRQCRNILGPEAALFIEERLRRREGAPEDYQVRLKPGAIERENQDRVAFSGSGNTAEFTASDSNGATIPIELSVSVIKLRGAWASIVIVRDITERKITENALETAREELEKRVNERTAELSDANRQLKQEIADRKRAEQELKLAEEKYRSIFENAVEGIFQSTPQGKFISANPAMARIFGYGSPEELIQSISNIGDEVYVSPEKRREFVRRLKEGGESPRIEAQQYRKDGAIIWTSIRARPIFDDKGELIRLDGILEDITERKRREEDLLKVEKLESIGVLAGGIAHDFNNLLTAILGNMSVIRHSLIGDKKSATRLEEAEKACLKAKGLTQQLLAFAKGGAPIKTTASVYDLISDASDLPLRGSNVGMRLKVNPEVWPIDVDEGQIGQVIGNIVLNAQQAMPEGGTIEIEAENVTIENEEAAQASPGKYVRISITDHGPGIPEENLNRIFDLYFTTKPKGSGLGLATAFVILNNHGGAISVDSKPGEGTTFSVILPASQGIITPSEFPEERLIIGDGKVLLMDDEEAIRDLAQDLLTMLGYEVEVAKDGRECIDLYCDARRGGQPFDVVILDLTIPGGMGGGATVQKLKEIDPEVKAIVSSGYSDDPIMANYYECGFCGVIPKPYDALEIGRVIASVIADNKRESTPLGAKPATLSQK